VALVELERLTWPAAQQLGDDAVGLVALGATEQHGPHLPLGMDTEIARALVRGLAASLREPVVVAPVISCGLSDHHVDFPGTISLSGEAVAAVLDGYVQGFARMGIARVGLISGHGGNFAFLGEYAAGCAERDPDLTVVAYDALWPNLTRALVARGYSDDEVAGLLGGNFLRVFGEAIGG
jgi:creatinine amidohydrolase